MGLLAVKVDTGYSWIVLLNVFVIVLITDGFPYAYGVLIPLITEKYNCTTATAAAIGSFTNGGHYVMAVLYNVVIAVCGCQIVGAVGGLFASGVFVFAAYSKSITGFGLTYGLLGGISVGLIYQPAIISLNLCFDQKRALVCSIAKFGGSLGLFVLSWLFQKLSSSYGLESTILAITALTGICSISAAMLRTPSDIDEGATEMGKPGAKELIVDYFDWGRMGSKGFCLFLLAIFFTQLAVMVRDYKDWFSKWRQHS